MNIDDETLRRVFSSRRLSVQEAFPDKRCPGESDVSLFFEASTPRKKKKELVDHIFGCPACLQLFQLLLEYDRTQASTMTETPAEARQQPPTPAPSRWKFLRLVPAVPLLFLALVAVGLLTNLPRGGALRSGEKTSPVIELVRPAGKLSEFRRPVFKWKRTTGADHYVIQIFDQELRPLWKSEVLYIQSFELPSSVSEILLPGRSYFWMVIAFSKDERPTESELVGFTIPDR
jgi:hypothetical protein